MKEAERHPRSKFGDFRSAIKNQNIGHFDTQIFAISLCVPTEAIEVLKRNMYGWKQR